MNHRLRAQAINVPARILEWRAAIGDNDTLGIPDEIWKEEANRLERLEDKLDRHRNILTILMPIATALAGVALAKDMTLLLVLSVLVFLELATTLLAVMEGSRSIPRHTLWTNDLESLLAEEAAKRSPALAAYLLAYAEANTVAGTTIHNLIDGAQKALFVSTVLIALIVGLLAPSALTAAPASEPSPPPISQTES